VSQSFFDFSGTHFSWGRPITSYTKTQMLIGWFLRKTGWIPSAKRYEGRQFLNIGCGPNHKSNFINLDYWWQPTIDICCDLRGGIPLPSATLQGVFTEHCLEHISYDDCQAVLREIRRVLKPGGTARIVVPDAQIFLDLYQKAQQGQPVTFPFEDEYQRDTPMLHVNRIFRDHGHLFAYDFETMKLQLERAGFTDVKKCGFRSGSRPDLLIDSEYRQPESMYVEGTVPAK
jgi:predicted SAM-dependent methyltransferase